MNSCPTALLPEYYREAMSTEDSEQIRLHVEGCGECRATVELFAALDNTVAEPPAAFWASLPGKVTEESRLRSRWGRVPAWVGGFAVAAAAALFLVMTAPVVEVEKGNFEETYAAYETGSLFSLGLEEELLSISGSDGDIAESYLDESPGEMAMYDEDSDPMDLLFDRGGLETMSSGTVEIFEKYIDEMTPNIEERG